MCHPAYQHDLAKATGLLRFTSSPSVAVRCLMPTGKVAVIVSPSHVHHSRKLHSCRLTIPPTVAGTAMADVVSYHTWASLNRFLEPGFKVGLNLPRRCRVALVMLWPGCHFWASVHIHTESLGMQLTLHNKLAVVNSGITPCASDVVTCLCNH